MQNFVCLVFITFTICLSTCGYVVMSEEDRRQLIEVSSPLLPWNSKDPVQFAKFGTKHPHPLHHLTGPKATHQNEKCFGVSLESQH